MAPDQNEPNGYQGESDVHSWEAVDWVSSKDFLVVLEAWWFVGCSWTTFSKTARCCFLCLYRMKRIQAVAAKRIARATIPMLNPIMGPLSGPGSGCTGIAVRASPLELVEWVGIRVCIEAGRVERVAEDKEVCVGFDGDGDGNDEVIC
jgi:hypothetical protein